MSNCNCNDQQYNGCVPAAKCISCPTVRSMTRPQLEPGQQWFNPVTGIMMLQTTVGLVPVSPAPGAGLRVNENGNMEVIAGRGLSVNLNTNAVEAALGEGLEFDGAGKIAVKAGAGGGAGTTTGNGNTAAATPPTTPTAGQGWTNTGSFNTATGIPAGASASWDGTKWVLTGGGFADRFLWANKTPGGTLPITSSLDLLAYGSDGAAGAISGVAAWPASGIEIKATGLYTITATLTCGLDRPAQVSLLLDQNDLGLTIGYLGRSATNGTLAAAVEVTFTGILTQGDIIKLRSNRLALDNIPGTATIVQYSAGITRIS